MKAKEGPRKWNSLALVLVIIPVIAIAQTVAVRDLGMAQGKAKSAAGQATAQKIAAEIVDAARRREIEASHYSATMRYASWMEQATNRVPSPSTFSDLYLKPLGDFKVSCETNRRSGTINYRVEGCQITNINAVFASLKQLPNRIRISQGTNSVSVAIRLPTQ